MEPTQRMWLAVSARTAGSTSGSGWRRAVAEGGRNDILAEAAGITAGSWYAWPSTHVGYELIAAGMLILAGNGRGLPFDYDELERWTRVGYERGMRSRKGER
jgi:hypothetical protein